MYWRQRPLKSLPIGEHVPLEDDELTGTFPSHAPTELAGFVDAAHATALDARRLVTGIMFMLAGGAIAFKSKLQVTVATSSAVAEFISMAVSAAKMAKYLWSVLADLGFPQKGPTTLYEDNQAAIAMVNESKPTARSRHVEIQHFAIQEWQRREPIVM